GREADAADESTEHIFRQRHQLAAGARKIDAEIAAMTAKHLKSSNALEYHRCGGSRLSVCPGASGAGRRAAGLGSAAILCRGATGARPERVPCRRGAEGAADGYRGE